MMNEYENEFKYTIKRIYSKDLNEEIAQHIFEDIKHNNNFQHLRMDLYIDDQYHPFLLTYREYNDDIIYIHNRVNIVYQADSLNLQIILNNEGFFYEDGEWKIYFKIYE